MAKQRKPTEERAPAPEPEREKSQVVPELDGEVLEADQLPELWGYGIEAGAGGWLAFRVSSHGAIEILNPRRNGELAGEKRHTALARMQTAIKLAYLGPQKRAG
jgi:hypothetical protein